MPLERITATTATSNSKTPLSLEKRHIAGLQHLGAKALWYDSFKDPNQVHTETSEKGVCQYGDSCKYFHPKNNLQNLNNQGMSGYDLFVSFDCALEGNNIIGDRMGVSWGNLPPSLKPPPAFVDWA